MADLIPQLHDVPTASDPASFDARADDLFSVQLPAVIDAMNELGQLVINYSPSTVSTTELTIGSGLKVLEVELDKSLFAGMTVRLAAKIAPSNWMQGDVQSYDKLTGALTFQVTMRQGSGTYSDWVLSPATSLESNANGADVASSATPNIWLTDGNKRNITGVVSILGFAESSYAGQTQWLRFETGLTLISSADLILGRSSYTTTDGDRALVIAETTTRFRVILFRVDGKATVTVITASDIPAATINRSHLGAGVARKVSNFGHPSASDYNYPSVMVQLEDSSLVGWGRNGASNLGLNTGGDEAIPAANKSVFNPPIPADQTIVKWARCSRATFAVLSNGWVYSTGSNNYGILGHGDTTTRTIFKRIEYFVTNSVQIADVWCESSRVTEDAACVFFLDSLGRAWFSGYNAVGQGGQGDTANKLTPVMVPSVTGIKEISMSPGYYNSVFLLKTDGTALAAGFNPNGQLGVGDISNKAAFVNVPGFSGNPIKKIRSTFGFGSSDGTGYAGHSILLTESGDVYTTGFNGYGQLGHGDTTSRNSFTKITALSNIIDVGCAGGRYGFSWALSATGRFYIWGYNNAGVVANGTTTNQPTPYNVAQYQTVDGATATTVSSDPPFVGVSGGQVKVAKVITGHSGLGFNTIIVLDTDGRIWISGHDYSYGTGLGGGTRTRFTQILLPQMTVPGEKFIDIAYIGYDQYATLYAITDQKFIYGCGFDSYCNASGLYTGRTYIYALQRIPV